MNRVGHDGGTLLQGGTSTRSSSKAGMEWKWKGVGIRWKGTKRDGRRRRKWKRKRVRENGSVRTRIWACQSWIRGGSRHVSITQDTGRILATGVPTCQGNSRPMRSQGSGKY
ncbi:hypothetical protein V8C26DRAFT_413885 [Trichoderma gracile]